jgi:hypothetical protein
VILHQLLRNKKERNFYFYFLGVFIKKNKTKMGFSIADDDELEVLDSFLDHTVIWGDTIVLNPTEIISFTSFKSVDSDAEFAFRVRRLHDYKSKPHSLLKDIMANAAIQYITCVFEYPPLLAEKMNACKKDDYRWFREFWESLFKCRIESKTREIILL